MIMLKVMIIILSITVNVHLDYYDLFNRTYTDAIILVLLVSMI